MPASETPKAVRRNFDQVIDRLNSRWDLQLPRLHGHVAELAENEGAVPRRITSRIRFLCFRPQLNLESLLEDFEDKAKQVKSNWVFKPSQEAGTLPQIPNEKSRLFAESLAKPLRLTSVQRTELLSYLDKLVDDEYRLSRDSAAYCRSAAEGPNNRSDREPPTPGQSPARPTTTDVSTPTTSPSRDIADSKMTEKSTLAGVGNGRKRSPSRDAVEVCRISMYSGTPLMDTIPGHRVSNQTAVHREAETDVDYGRIPSGENFNIGAGHKTESRKG
jgi:hypothetical protein